MEMIKIVHPDRPDSPPATVSIRAFEAIWQEQGFVRFESPLERVVRELAEEIPSVEFDNEEE